MKHSAKTILFVILSVSILLIAGGGAAVAWRYFQAARSGEIQVNLPVTTNPDTQAVLGESVKVAVAVTIPWGQSIRSVVLQPGADWTLSGKSSFAIQTVLWGANQYWVQGTLKAFRTGESLPLGTFQIKFREESKAPANRMRELSVDLGTLKVVPVTLEEKDALPLAGTIAAPVQPFARAWVWLAGAALLVLLLTMYIFYRRRMQRAEAMRNLPPWEVAEEELAALRGELQRDDANYNGCFVRLTDVVRDYLAKRFALAVTRQTTEEFLNGLKRDNTPLSREQSAYLGDFMKSSELIRFARQNADGNLLEHAIGKAETLVRETRPAELPGTEKNASGTTETPTRKTESSGTGVTTHLHGGRDAW